MRESLWLEGYALAESRILELAFERVNTRLIARCQFTTDEGGNYVGRGEGRIATLTFDVVQELRFRNALTDFQVQHVADLSEDLLEVADVIVDDAAASLLEYSASPIPMCQVAFRWERQIAELPAREIVVICGYVHGQIGETGARTRIFPRPRLVDVDQ
jgi:hypothetical protein